jgi:DNA-binding response OmpR family regulator
MSGHVLLVEDEPSVGELVRSYLARDGWIVIWVRSGEEAIAELGRHSIRIVILDIGLPGMDGFAVCQEMRSRSRVPILMLTARDEEADRVVGLEVGADDYLTKPFSPREMVARMKAILRRSEPQPDHDLVALGDVTLNRETHDVTIAGRPVELTAKEFDLLAFFLSNPEPVLLARRPARSRMGRLVSRRDANGRRTSRSCDASSADPA